MKVAVVGGGWAGLAAAVELTCGGCAVTLFEAGRVFGGRARTVQIDGRVLDNGQHLLLGAYRETLDLLARIGVAPDTVLTRLPLAVHGPDGFRLSLPDWPAPFNVLWGLLTAHPVPWREKWRTACWMQALKWRKFRLPADQPVSAWLMEAGQTGTLARQLWEPLCLAALNTPPAIASAQRFAHVLRDSLGSAQSGATDLLLPRVPLGDVLPAPAIRWLYERGATLRAGHRVRRLEMAGDAPQVDGEDFAAVIVATAPQHLGTLLPATSPALAYEPIATVYLETAETLAESFPLAQLGGEDRPWRVTRADGRLAVVYSAHGPWEALDDSALIHNATRALGLASPPAWARVIREKRATFSCRPQRPVIGWQTGHARIWLAGDHTWADYPGTLEGAVRSGRRAALAAIQALGMAAPAVH